MKIHLISWVNAKVKINLKMLKDLELSRHLVTIPLINQKNKQKDFVIMMISMKQKD